MEQKFSTDIENKKRINETIQQIYHLFEQLKQILMKTLTSNETLSPASILLHLGNICFDLTKQKYHTPIDAIDIFEYILKNYIELLDDNRFISIIAHGYTVTNNDLIHSLFTSLDALHWWFSIDQITSKVRQQMYYRLLDQLTSSTRISSFLKNQFEFQSTENDKVNRTVASSCGSIIIIVLKHLTVLHGRSIDIEFDKYQNTLFTSLITFLDEYFMTNKCSQNDMLVQEIFFFLFHISNKTLNIPIFINVNCPQACLRWLSLSYLRGYEYISILGILCNIARHDNGVIILGNYDWLKILRRFQSEIADTMIIFVLDKEMHKQLSINWNMMFMLTVDVWKIDLDDADIFIADELIPAIKFATNSPKQEYLKFHIAELWFVVMKLCIHDKTFDLILQNNKSPGFFSFIRRRFLYYTENTDIDNLYLNSNILTVMTLINILWSISFHGRYKNVLIQSTEMIERLETFRTIDKVVFNTYIPRYIFSLRRASDGIWHNLYPLKSEIKSSQNKSICSVMISYSHINIDFCRQFYDILNILPQLSISVDFINSKYLWKEIAETIEQSDLVLFLISKDFFYSKSCRQEFTYATDTLKKTFIPVYIDGDYQAKGWLESRLTGLKYIRFGEGNFMSTCDELLSMMNERLSINIPSVLSVKNSSDVEQWNSKDVQQWFTNNNIIPELYEFYQFRNGNELLSFAQAILPFPWTKEYERIRVRFEEKFKQQKERLSSFEFSKFIHALERLRSKSFNPT